MIVAETIAALRAARAGLAGPVGFVPTMGALHDGHLSLIRRARAENAAVVISVFVNPAQFGPHEDLARYPRALERDLGLAAHEGVDLTFAPRTEEIYAQGFATYVEVEGLTRRWEGERRPGHFRGVATVVHRLFLLVQPDRAYFGEKDYQQLVVVRRLATDFPVPPPSPSPRPLDPTAQRLEVIACPTVRDPDGLALSSRNAHLGPDDRRRATALWRALRRAQQLLAEGERRGAALEQAMTRELEASGARADYVAVVDPQTLEPVATVEREARALVAAYVGCTRLIDNAALSARPLPLRVVDWAAATALE